MFNYNTLFIILYFLFIYFILLYIYKSKYECFINNIYFSIFEIYLINILFINIPLYLYISITLILQPIEIIYKSLYIEIIMIIFELVFNKIFLYIYFYKYTNTYINKFYNRCIYEFSFINIFTMLLNHLIFKNSLIHILLYGTYILFNLIHKYKSYY